MQHSLIPACYFPSTVLFIDDSRNFLLNFVLQLDEWLAYRVFDSPFNALDHIHKKHCELATFSQRCLDKFTDLKKYTTRQQVNTLLHSEIYNPHRFSEISVIVVDYAMSEIDGLEFCHKISHTPIKKILLTSKSDEQAARAAFNAGLIDCYIPKKDPNVADLITHSINELQRQYFQGMAKSIFHELSLTPPACLQDKKFITFFKQLCDEKGIVEFYLTDNTGSFLLLDQDAQISFLIVKSDEERMVYLELARRYGASNELINQLSKGEKIPAVTQLADSSNQDWLTSLLPANQLTANNTYWYSYSDELLLDINKEELLSYHHHLEEIDAEELLLLSS
ncbi:Response regulator containing a CheY-like receiver domain and an HD-GYP domain [Legionella beliardensis]|uniref:Response regulator containing a CheY-like receiver domain and an HD-GYP domain n=1 Tax=Legionella beliardensis TaxID=91822 RepID=A0A378I4W0_9GAMM|nr:response regulator [Legionella beliardensis]STX29882.1 Response regulator containing a CheY-like receiver domain and an HD-GYP domain [Legionella beliardensis]